MNTRIKAFITDFDGTLAYTYEANLAAYKKAISDATDNKYQLTDNVYSSCFGYRFCDFMDAINITDSNMRSSIRELKAKYYADYSKDVIINNELLNTLKFAKLNNIKIVLATTARAVNVNNVLIAHDIDLDFFDLILTGESVSKGKPDPEIYLTAMKILNITSDEVIIFEDSDIGIAAAVSAGCNYIKVG